MHPTTMRTMQRLDRVKLEKSRCPRRCCLCWNSRDGELVDRSRPQRKVIDHFCHSDCGIWRRCRGFSSSSHDVIQRRHDESRPVLLPLRPSHSGQFLSNDCFTIWSHDISNDATTNHGRSILCSTHPRSGHVPSNRGTNRGTNRGPHSISVATGCLCGDW